MASGELVVRQLHRAGYQRLYLYSWPKPSGLHWRWHLFTGQRDWLQRSWREWLSNCLYSDWLTDDRGPRRSAIEGHHEAPEYRIAEDARVATDLPIDLVTGLLQSVLTIATFVGLLWSVGGSLEIAFDGIAFAIPGYLVLAVIAYSALLAIGIWLTAGRLTRVIEENKRMEAELRAIGTHVRETREGLI